MRGGVVHVGWKGVEDLWTPAEGAVEGAVEGGGRFGTAMEGVGSAPSRAQRG